MQIVLTPEDIQRLKPATRQALFADLGIEAAGAMMPTRSRRGGRGAGAGADKAAADPLPTLVDSINDRARAALSQLVNAGGQADWKAIATKVPKLELGRFMASVHRRYRTLTRDPDAVIIKLQQDGEHSRLRLAPGLVAKLKPLLKD